MTILAIGVSCIDITFDINESFVENKKYICSKQHKSGGGPAFNAAYLCSLWNQEIYLISRIGHDEYGEQIRKLC